jgi:ATP/maltotriose-dependent transcriptional regulator MalT
MEADNGGAPFVQAALVLAMADSELPLEIYDAGIAAAQRQGSMFAFAANKVFRGHVLLLRGALAAAETDVREGLEAAEAYGIAIAPAWASAYLADALTEQGRLDDAGAALERAGLGPDPPDDAHAHWFLDSRARLLLACGKLGDGLAATLEAGRRFERVGGRNPAWMAWRSQAALALVGLGEDRARARALVREELELAREWGAPRALGRALRAAGLVAGGEQGLNLLREAVEVLEGSPAQLELARALADLGSTLRRSGQRAASREPLRRALELGHRCGATALAERAREELLATGARPRRIMRTGVDALTTSELRVARMAADGMTNREIAQALFVTLRTVEVHLTHTYEKLDISARRELPAALAVGAG